VKLGAWATVDGTGADSISASVFSVDTASNIIEHVVKASNHNRIVFMA